MEYEEFQKFNARFKEWMVRQHRLFGTECYLCHDGTWDIAGSCPLPHP